MTWQDDSDKQGLREKRNAKSRADFDAIMQLAGFAVSHVWELANRYWPLHPDYDEVRDPWWLYMTEIGPVQIGWRKRVIAIRWDATPIRVEVTTDEVTKGDDQVHAYSAEKAVEYLKALRATECMSAAKSEPATPNAGEAEPWEWDGDCSRCFATLDWEGDQPETEEDAICFSCMEVELHALRKVAAPRPSEAVPIPACELHPASAFWCAGCCQEREAELRDTVTSIRGERDAARAHTEEALASNAKLREKLREAVAPSSSSRPASKTEPIPMVLHCPECRTRHIDEGEFATKPHHTHSCQGCGLTWRPSIAPTVGVQFLPGFRNASPAERAA